MDICEYDKDKHGPGRCPVYHWRVGIPIIYPSLFHVPIGAQVVFLIYDPSIWGYLPIEGPYIHYGILPIQFSYTNQVPVLVILMINNIFSRRLHTVHTVGLDGGLLEGEVIFSWFYVGGQVVSEVGNIVCIGLVFFFVVEHLGFKKTLCFWYNALGGRHFHRYKEVNMA